MISVFGYELILPDWLSFLSGNLGSFLGTLVVSVILGVVSYFLLFVVLNWFFRKSETEIDDVILGVSRTPFITFVTLFALERSAVAWGIDGVVVGGIDRILKTIIVFTLTWWISRVLKEGVIYQLREISKKSEAAWDDVLVPVIERVAPPIIWTIGIIISLEFLGANLTGLYVALGGGAFILAFALQDILSNLFSGLVLLLDTPFRFGDVVKMEDDRIVVIKDIGLRVTHLYNIGDHSDIFMPNALLGGTSIVNITRPTTDLVASFVVGVGYNSDVNKAREILDDVICGHPDILGDIVKKVDLIDSFKCFDERKISVSKKKLEAEQKVNAVLTTIELKLSEFSKLASKLEKGGVEKIERKELQEKYDEIIKLLGLRPVKKPRRLFGRVQWELVEDKSDESLNNQVLYWVSIWQTDPSLVEEDLGENGVLAKEWESKLFFLKERIERLFHYVMNPQGHERRLDTDAQGVIDWIHDNFKQSRVLWKDPNTQLVDFGASSLDFKVSFFVDNIKLEHYERAERIKDELRMEIKRRFDEEKIELPFPQQDVWFRNVLSTK